MIQIGGSLECPICFRKVANHVIVPCGHVACIDCLNIIQKINNSCPICRQPLQQVIEVYGIKDCSIPEPKKVKNKRTAKNPKSKNSCSQKKMKECKTSKKCSWKKGNKKKSGRCKKI